MPYIKNHYGALIARRVGTPLRSHAIGSALITLIVILLCLLPKQEHDLFFILRIGSDILHSHRVPYIDTYSWVNYGTPWDLPEWLAFVCYALAYQYGRFFGTWLLLLTLTLSAGHLIYWELRRKIGTSWGFLLTLAALLALSACIQERPYAFTYLLLTLSLIILIQARQADIRKAFWLIPICALWANLNQGVMVILGLLLLYSFGDFIEAYLQSKQISKKALIMFVVFAACATACMVSPYGWLIYWNVFITLRDPSLMANVAEWNSIITMPIAQLQAFILLAFITAIALKLSPRRNLPDILVVSAACIEAICHTRNIAIFAIVAVLIGADHIKAASPLLYRYTRVLPDILTRRRFTIAVVLLYIVTLALVVDVQMRKEVGPSHYSLEGIGQIAISKVSYPEKACAFMDENMFPSNLRLYNDFEIGGFLMWRRPAQRVFADGRLDVYTGKTFNNMVILAQQPGSARWIQVERQYNLDCVVTMNRKVSDAFLADGDWQLVYTSPKRRFHKRSRVLLRINAANMALINRCLSSQPDHYQTGK